MLCLFVSSRLYVSFQIVQTNPITAAIKKLGEQNHFEVDTTTDASMFNDKDLKQYRAVIFLSTTGNILNSDEQVAFQRYIEAGGGFLGIHAAADAEYNWAWYNKLVGA